jgi:hypothetical protein
VDNITSAPLLTFPFLGGAAGGFGNSGFGNTPFGGGRIVTNEKLFAFVAKFKLLKLKIIGTTTAPLRFVSITIAYLMGSLRR